ncbi:MAG TPA: hypothetical protein VEJ36_01565, partial [Nitrososphaerales archaeon]|nr:hypothetical protein [Nitrososphaerales archaeon]
MSAGAALLVSFYAFRVNRLVESTLLRYISIGFMLLGAGLVAEGLTQAVTGVTVITASRFSGLRLIVFILFTALQLVAYFIFAWGYALSAFGKQQPVLASAPALLAASKTNVLKVIIFSLAVFLIAQL